MPKSKKARVASPVSSDDSDAATSVAESDSIEYESSLASDNGSSDSDVPEPEPKKRKSEKGGEASSKSKASKASKASKESKESKASKASKASKENKESKESKASKASKASKESDASKASKASKSSKASKESKTTKSSKASKASKGEEVQNKSRPPSDDEEVENDESDDDTMTSEIIERYKQHTRKFIKRDNMFGFRKVLAETPLAAVLENLHYMFVASNANDEMFDELVKINAGFNIVSKKFIKSLRTSSSSREWKQKYAECEQVAEGIQNNTPLKDIDGISDYTPEFIIMKTIQVGDVQACNAMMQKWKLAPRFAEAKHLIAALYGWEDFLGKMEKVSKTQNLVVHALCGGFPGILRIVSSGSGGKWILPETLQKAGLVCPVRPEMKTQFKKMLSEAL